MSSPNLSPTSVVSTPRPAAHQCRWRRRTRCATGRCPAATAWCPGPVPRSVCRGGSRRCPGPTPAAVAPTAEPGRVRRTRRGRWASWRRNVPRFGHASLLLGNGAAQLGAQPRRPPRACPNRGHRLGEGRPGTQLFHAAPPPLVPEQTQSRCAIGDIPWPGAHQTLDRDREHPTTGTGRRGLVGGHDMGHPAPERVQLDPADREAVQAKQTRGVRDRILLNMLNVRTLEQARDLTL